MSLYAVVGKVLFFIAYPGMRLLGSKLTGRRVRILVMSEQGRILLVKTWFGSQTWSLPGGGIKKGESPVDAALRELMEETAIEAQSSELKLLGEMASNEKLPFRFIVYKLVVVSEDFFPLPSGRQYDIIGRRWYAPNELPEDCSPVVTWALER